MPRRRTRRVRHRFRRARIFNFVRFVYAVHRLADAGSRIVRFVVHAAYAEETKLGQAASNKVDASSRAR